MATKRPTTPKPDPAGPGRSPTRGKTSAVSGPRSPTRGSARTTPPRRAPARSASENMVSRAFQSLILIAGVMLLSTFFFGGRWGPAMVGAMVFLSAFPPVRRHVDRWLVGTSKGDEADQAAIIRMGAGLAITLLAILITPGG